MLGVPVVVVFTEACVHHHVAAPTTRCGAAQVRMLRSVDALSSFRRAVNCVVLVELMKQRDAAAELVSKCRSGVNASDAKRWRAWWEHQMVLHWRNGELVVRCRGAEWPFLYNSVKRGPAGGTRGRPGRGTKNRTAPRCSHATLQRRPTTSPRPPRPTHVATLAAHANARRRAAVVACARAPLASRLMFKQFDSAARTRYAEQLTEQFADAAQHRVALMLWVGHDSAKVDTLENFERVARESGPVRWMRWGSGHRGSRVG